MVNIIAMTRAAAGSMFLDSVRPGWRRAIYPEKLDMRSPTWCILGQVFHVDGIKKTEYWRSIQPPQEKDKPPPPPPRKLSGYDYARMTYPELVKNMYECGFDSGVVDLESLKEAWLEIVNE